jgi:hypothetical protein
VPLSVPRPGDEPPHPSREVARLERLDQVIVRSEKQARRAVEIVDLLAGDEDDGQLGAQQPVELAAQLEPADVRESHVGDHERRPLPTGDRDRLGTGGRLDNTQGHPLQQGRDKAAEIRLVVDYQDWRRDGQFRVPRHRDFGTDCDRGHRSAQASTYVIPLTASVVRRMHKLLWKTVEAHRGRNGGLKAARMASSI